MADDPTQQTGGVIDLRTQDAPSAGAAQTQATTSTTSTTATAQSTEDQSLFEKFEIPESVRTQYPDLIPLILQTESMNDDERQYWFQILPIMTDDQVTKLREILENEKKQLSELDQEYQQELKRINDKHVSEWKQFQADEKRKKLQDAEESARKTEEDKQEELLKNLQQL